MKSQALPEGLDYKEHMRIEGKTMVMVEGGRKIVLDQDELREFATKNNKLSTNEFDEKHASMKVVRPSGRAADRMALAAFETLERKLEEALGRIAALEAALIERAVKKIG